ncbi:Glutamyl-tRNA(Gln) amidotransferase subunit A [bacterium HR34]|nr:Glutamyl-tRNA(Gln) amidotransferase subunit A [bacterium HR34]
MDLSLLSISEIQKLLKNKEISCEEITKFYLEKIKKEDKEINSFVSVFEEEAINRAKNLDNMLKNEGLHGDLFGVPIAVKDNILVKDLLCTAGSKILSNYMAVYNATVVEKLLSHNAIILGKTNLDEFAMGSSGETSFFGKTLNPLDKERVPGGSSSGSAAAVAAGFSPVSLGSDTGGSIRLPAAFCGVYGFKPTYGAVSRYGLISMASSLDQIGPFAKNIDDIITLFNVIRGKDKKDATSLDDNLFKNKEIDLKDIRIGLPKEYFGEGLDVEIKEKVLSFAKQLENQGCKIDEVSLPYSKYGIHVYYLIMASEVSSNLSRYDGIRYGFSTAEKDKELFSVYSNSRGEGFGIEVKRRILLGTFALYAGYYDAYYNKAQKVRYLIKKDFNDVFSKYDFILTPTSPTLPFRFGEKSDPLQMYLSDIMTVSANLAGIPAISIPYKEKENDFPVGVQIMANTLEDYKLLNFVKLIS